VNQLEDLRGDGILISILTRMSMKLPEAMIIASLARPRKNNKKISAQALPLPKKEKETHWPKEL